VDFVMGFFTGLLVWEWILLVIVFGGSCMSLYNESGYAWVVLAGIGFVYFVQPHLTVINVLLYLAIGGGWMFFKFRRHANRIIDKIKIQDANAKANYEERVKTVNNVDNIAAPKASTAEEVKGRVMYAIDGDVLSFWMMAWPFSVFGFVFYDMLKEFFSKVLKFFGTYVDKMIAKAGF